MATRRNTSDKDDTKTAAEQDTAAEQETTDQAEAKAAEVPSEPKAAESKETDEATAEAVEDTENAVGVTSERDVDGKEYEAPYTYLTAQDLARTSDWDDPARSWVAQENSEREEKVGLTEVFGTPGQTFRKRELPDRKVVEAAGIDYAQFLAGLPVRPDVPNEAPRQGIPA